MIVEQLYTKCLAEAAYYIESNGEVAIIDPMRETDQYVELAEKNGAKIKYIFETHFHADFVSGHVDLAKKTGAAIVYGPTAETGFDSIIATDGQEFKIGTLTIRLIHTPGHTPESSTYLLIDEDGNENALFTGDTLFLGDVGRPDLAIKSDLTREDLAGMLFDSLRNKLMGFADETIIYPGHGAGSSCGKNMSDETVGTLGDQKETNYALRANMTKEEFVEEVTTGILPPPQYFPKNAQLNKLGYESFESILSNGNKALNIDGFISEFEKGALILDVRHQFDFVKGFIPDSLFIGLDGTFAMWVGALIADLDQKIILITEPGREEEAITRLARVGYSGVVGYLNGGITSYDGELYTMDSISPVEFEKADRENIIDIRRDGEYSSEHLEGAEHYPLDYMTSNIEHLDARKTYHIHCAGGYRSVIAISLLMQNGYTKLINVEGGYTEIKLTNIPKTDFVCPTTL